MGIGSTCLREQVKQSSGDSPSRTTTSPEIFHPAERATSSLHQVLAGSRIARRKSPIALSEDLWSEGVLGNTTFFPFLSTRTWCLRVRNNVAPASSSSLFRRCSGFPGRSYLRLALPVGQRALCRNSGTGYSPVAYS